MIVSFLDVFRFRQNFKRIFETRYFVIALTQCTQNASVVQFCLFYRCQFWIFLKSQREMVDRLLITSVVEISLAYVMMRKNKSKLILAVCVYQDLYKIICTLLKASSLILIFTTSSSLWLVILYNKLSNLRYTSSLIESELFLKLPSFCYNFFTWSRISY